MSKKTDKLWNQWENNKMPSKQLTEEDKFKLATLVMAAVEMWRESFPGDTKDRVLAAAMRSKGYDYNKLHEVAHFMADMCDGNRHAPKPLRDMEAFLIKMGVRSTPKSAKPVPPNYRQKK